MCCRLPDLKRVTAAILLALTCIAPVRADDLDDLNRAVEAAMSHHRVASGYLRTGNVDLAALELEGMREAWGKVTSLPKPAAFRDTERYTGTMLDISTKLVGVALVLDLGAVDVARKSLDTIRASLSELRRANGVTVLADCVLDSNTAMDALFAHDARPDWATVSGSAGAYRATLQRCDGMAPPAVRGHAEFRRLIDGALASLAQVPKAIETRDGDLLHRLLIELRSFDHLLAFRYG
jgi:hypothetical protein